MLSLSPSLTTLALTLPTACLLTSPPPHSPLTPHPCPFTAASDRLQERRESDLSSPTFPSTAFGGDVIELLDDIDPAELEDDWPPKLEVVMEEDEEDEDWER